MRPSAPIAPRPAEELATLGLALTAAALVTLTCAAPGPASLARPAEPRTALFVGLELAIAWAAYFVGARVRTLRDASTWRGLFVEGNTLARAARVALLALVPLTLVLGTRAVVLVPSAAVLLGLWHALVVRTIVRVARAPLPRIQRLGASVMALAIVAPPVLLASWGVFSSVLQAGLSRVVHLGTRPRSGERARVIETADGLALDAIVTPPRDGRASSTGVLLVHGFADGPRQLAPVATRLAEEGLTSLRLTLRAHGTSDGALVTFTERERMDVIAAADALLVEPGVRTDCFAALGVSMGGGTLLAASDALVSRGLGGLVVLAPPSDFAAIVTRALPDSGLVRSFALAEITQVSHALGAPSPLETVPREALAAVPALPILVFHSPVDRTVPYAQSEALRDVHGQTTLVTIAHVSHGQTPEEVLASHASEVRAALAAACP